MSSGRRLFVAALASALALPVSTGAVQAEVAELKVTKQPGLLFTPTLLMEHHKLVEKHAKAAGLDVKAEWVTLLSGGAANDALLSGNVHIVTSGVSNLLILWGKSNGDVKAITAVSGLPFKSTTTSRSSGSRALAPRYPVRYTSGPRRGATTWSRRGRLLSPLRAMTSASNKPANTER